MTLYLEAIKIIIIKKHPFKKVRHFFIRSICHAYQMQNIETLEYFLESILVVALSHTLTSNSDKSLSSETRFEYVDSVIKEIPIVNDKEVEQVEMYKNGKTEEDKKLKYNFEKEHSKAWIKRFEKIYKKASNIASQCCDGEMLNAYYNVEVSENIKRLMYYLPLWTGIMIPFFDREHRVATSSSVESEFANIKTRAFKNKSPERADIFHHVDYLDGRVKEMSTKFVFSEIESTEKKSKTV